MPLFKSLRARSSRKSSASVASDAESNTDFGPQTPGSTVFGSMRSTKGGPTDYRSNSKRSLSKVDSSAPSSPPPSLPQYTSSSSVHGKADTNGGSTAEGRNASMRNAVSQVSLSTPTGIDTSTAKPRPSDLFAGKGVQWDAVNLAGSNVSPGSLSKSNTNEELQNFLKMRRQWKPTFATEDSDGMAAFQPPDDLTQLTFSSGEKIQSKGLMSLKDLDESHQRKQQLLSSTPLGQSLLDEQPETSKAGSSRAAAEASAPATNKGKAEPLRKENSKSSKTGGRKLFGGDKPVLGRSTSGNHSKASELQAAKVLEGEPNNSVSRVVPEASEVEKESKGPREPAVLVSSGLVGAVDGGQTEGSGPATGMVRESMESNQFQTPNGSSTELAETEEGDKTLTMNGSNGKGESDKDLKVETMIPDSTAQTDPSTPRPVVPSGEERSITPTPANVEAAS